MGTGGTQEAGNWRRSLGGRVDKETPSRTRPPSRPPRLRLWFLQDGGGLCVGNSLSLVWSSLHCILDVGLRQRGLPTVCLSVFSSAKWISLASIFPVLTCQYLAPIVMGASASSSLTGCGGPREDGWFSGGASVVNLRFRSYVVAFMLS